MFSSTLAKSYKATGVTPSKNAYKKGVHVLHKKKLGRLCVCHVLKYWGLLRSRCLLCNESFQQDKLDASERDTFNV